MWKGQLSNLIHTDWQVHNSTATLQYKLAMPDDQFIFSSWLPSPRIRTTGSGRLKMRLVTSLALNVLRSRKNTLDSGGKIKDALPTHIFRALYCIPLCSESGNTSLCRQKIFQTDVIDKTFENNTISEI
jgi:hypothetical protein